MMAKRKKPVKGGKPNTNKSAKVKGDKKQEGVPGSSRSFGEKDVYVYVDAKLSYPDYPDDESYMEEDSEQESEN